MRIFEKVLVWLLVASQVGWAIPVDAGAPQALSAPPVTAAPAGPISPASAPPPTIRPNRRVPAVKPVRRTPVFSAWPTEQEIFGTRVLEEPLVPVNGSPSPEETRALARSLQAYLANGSGENVGPLVAFLEGHAVSVWRASLQLNLGLVYLRTGYYSRAVRLLGESWAVAQRATDPHGRGVADRALGELIRLNARLGKPQQLEELLQAAEQRNVGGSAAEMIEQGKQILWFIRHHPERSLRCGPVGIGRILALAKPDRGADPIVDAFAASARGTTLLQMRDLSAAVGLDLQMAKRDDRRAEMPAPALIHWDVGHFAALLKAEERGFLIEDPAFGPARWRSRQVLGDEASGYALVPAGPLPRGWRPVDEKEAETVWGMGPTCENDPECQTGGCGGGGAGGGGGGGGGDHQSGGSSQGGGCTGGYCPKRMADYSFHTMLVSLHVFDTPVGYAPPRGPAVQFGVNYHQREVFQPQIFTYSNLGPKWTSLWISYVEDDPTSPGQPATVYLRAGGRETYTSYDPATHAYDYHPKSRAQVVKVADDPVVYERRLPDGGRDVYAQPNGALAFPRKVFLTRSIDPQGNTAELTYDSSLRLVAITDAIGQVTTLSHDLPGDSYKITRVTDPFGRYASFEYDSLGRLSRITDVVGIQSSFEYGAGDFVKSLTTPYGTTAFRTAEAGRQRWLEATDPLGGTERLEYVNSIRELAPPATITFPDALPPSQVPTGFYWAGSETGSSYYWYRNTFYWSKRAHAEAPGDYTAATLIHWKRSADLTQTAGVIENEKEPLETVRTFYKYPNQTPTTVGSHATPSGVGRVLDDGTSQIWQYEYNALGKVIRATDPVGRTTIYTYAANEIDLLRAERVNGQDLELIRSYTYNDKHQPLTVTDARGAVTTYTYNTAGQVLTVTTPPAQGHGQGGTTTFTYDTNGYLQQVSGPVPAATTTFTYDDYGRRCTVTDPAGLTLTYDYDALDRVTKVTYPDTTYEETAYHRLDAEKRRDRLGRWTQTFYDALRRPLATRDAAGQTTQYQYGGSGCISCAGGGDKLTKLIDPNGSATTWDYDLQGRVTQETRADASSESYTYETTTSRLKQKTDRRNVTTTFEYFLDGKLKRKSYSDTTPAVDYTYDPVDGNMLTAANGTDTLTWAYDSMDRVATEASAKNASTVGYAYDDAGNRTVLSLDGVTHVTYGYDQYSRLASITRGANVFGFGYDTASRRSSMTYPNGVVTSYGYDGESRLTSLGASLGSTPITSFSYVLDAAGNRTRKTTLDWAEDYRYDDVNRLVSADRSAGTPSRWRFAYDPAGNRTGDQTDDAAMGATFNNVNELQSRQAGGALTFKGTTSEPASVTVAGQSARTAADNSFTRQTQVPSGTSNVVVAATDPSGNTRTNTYQVSASGVGASYTYDSNGNLTQKTEGSDNWSYEWNGENELTRVTKNGVEVARFAYDPDGRRVEKVVGGMTTTYTYGAEDVVREIRGTTTLKYVHGPGFDEPLAADDGSALSYFQPDALGSIVKVTSATGAVAATRQYDAWGDLEVGVSEPGYAFTGREWDPETRLFYYRARYYDPRIGRFMSEDPIGFKGGRNFYAYVNNDPARRVDPLGLLGDPYTTACTVTFGGYAWRQGKRWGWPYAHCIASCLIARYCGQDASYTSGEAKEYWDWAWCKTGNRDSCNSAFQPSDYQDNFTGATCPIQITCEQACAHRKNQNPPPGPYGGQGWR